MKRYLWIIFCMTAVLALVSCNKENEGVIVDDCVDVVFNITTDDSILTKAVGGAIDYEKTLSVFVYKDGQYLENAVRSITHFGMGLEADCIVRLTKGQKYDIVFWAQAKDTKCFAIDPETGVLTVDYSDAQSNDDLRDAFCFVKEDYEVSQSKQDNAVVLKRPFAQINVGTGKDDLNDASFSGVDINKTEVVLGNVADQLNLLTGIATGNVSVTFKAADLIKEDLVLYKGTEKEEKYSYLSMNYILVGDAALPGTKVLLNNYTITFCSGADAVNSIDIPNVPVRRNWRTNIVGKDLLTEASAFDVVIDPDFYGEYVFNGHDVDKVLYVDSATGEYLIENPAQIAFISEVVNGGYNSFDGKVIKLAQDLDLTGWEITPIGTNAYPFKGTIDGDGCTLMNLTIKSNGNSGLFGFLAGTVKNLTLTGFDVTGGNFVGGLAGYLTGTVENASVNASHITNSGPAETSATGSVVGYAVKTSTTKNLSSDIQSLNLVGYQE